jgi:hypothetical protein
MVQMAQVNATPGFTAIPVSQLEKKASQVVSHNSNTMKETRLQA